jgi:hypothetical protein
MGSVCSCNDNDKIIEEHYQKRLRNIEQKVDELYYQEDKIESGIFSDNEDELT